MNSKVRSSSTNSFQLSTQPPMRSAGIATRYFLDTVARRTQDQRVVLKEALGMAASYATSK